jgi:hypothetical protein
MTRYPETFNRVHEHHEGVLGFDSEDRRRRSEPRDPGVLVKNPGNKINANDESFALAA